MHKIELTPAQLETLRHAIATAWHMILKTSIARDYAELLDNIERQTGTDRTALGVPTER